MAEKRLYVGNLAFSTTEDVLRERCAVFGEIESVRIIIDRETNRSRGFGFVEFKDESAAKEAINGLNGFDFDGRKLVVNEARPRDSVKA